MSVEVLREEGSQPLLRDLGQYRTSGLLLGRSCAVSRGHKAVTAEDLRHARAGALDRLARVAEALAEELAVFTQRLDHVLEPLTRKGDRPLLGVSDGVGDRIVDPRDVRRPLGPPAADLQPIAVALPGAL